MTSCYCCCCCSCCCCQLRIHRSPICFKHPLCSFKRSNGMKFSSQCDSNCDKCFESVWSEFQWIVVPTGGDDSTLSLSLSLSLANGWKLHSIYFPPPLQCFLPFDNDLSNDFWSSHVPRKSSGRQCDLMARSFFRYLAIYRSEIVPRND